MQQTAWALLQPYFERDQAEAIKSYYDSAGTGLTTNDVKQAVLAAFDGRVSVLFVALGVQEWGTFDRESRKVRLYDTSSPNTEDLLDFAAAHTLMKGGTVYCVEPETVPDNAKIAAILRY